MPNALKRLEVQNFRSLASVNLEVGPINVLFGPNGVGKSSLMDTLWFLRDCAIRGVEQASTFRNHGVGMMWVGAEEPGNIKISLEIETAIYSVEMGYSSGRIEAFVGEKLASKTRRVNLIERRIGADKADFYHLKMKQMASFALREPEKLALTRYVDFEDGASEAIEVDQLLHYIHLYKAREADLFGLKRNGSESGHQTWLWERGQNLWSVLRNLKDRRGLDERYDTIIDYMKKSFPGDFLDVFVEQTGPNTVYGSFQQEGLSQLIQASGVSDGHLQMLINLTCLFAEGRDRTSILMFDEPEISLHPLALAIFADAVKDAASNWNKQIMIATHSPVLMSQFDAEQVFVMQKQANRSTTLQRVSNMANIQDLLAEYALGSLYMAEAIAPQSSDPKPFSG
ncbi:MAG: AAA family ATPase [Chloroflexi bacterium]|nr:AAA family ATPase [Chloroflexota bacterium]